MKKSFKLEENVPLSSEAHKRILSLLDNQALTRIEFYIDSNSENSLEHPESQYFLTRESLLRNLIDLQSDALELEEQITRLKEQNNYLEEKINWLRTKVGEGNIQPSKAKFEYTPSLSDSGLQSALVQIINTFESKAREKASLSFSRSKRMRKDKALIAQSEFFDKDYVTSQLKMLGLQVKDPLEFFVSFGTELELSPSEKFDTKSYLAMNPDVKDSGINPLLHYIKPGKAEGRVLI